MKKLSKTDEDFIELQSCITLAEWAKKFRGWTWKTAIEKYLEYWKDRPKFFQDMEYEFWEERLEQEKERLPFTTPTEDLLNFWKKRSLFKDEDREYLREKARQINSMGYFLNRLANDTDNRRKETARK